MKKDYWFTAKRYGWGWVPSSREGWLVTILFIAAVIWVAKEGTTSGVSVTYMIEKLVALAALLIFICWRTGEPPRWRWGGKDVFLKK